MAPLRLAFITAGMMTGSQVAVETRVASVKDDNDSMLSAAASTLKLMSSSSKDKDDGKATSIAAIATSINSSSNEASELVRTSAAPTTKENECRSDVVHFCFIVHGHQGKPTDLSYLHHAIKDKANQHSDFATAKSSERCPVGKNDTLLHDEMAAKMRNTYNRANKEEGVSQTNLEDIITGTSKGSAFIVHNAVCNEGTTHDGVERGGERLANEMLDVIRSELGSRTHKHEQDVTISIVGNSLGGLYGRYAVAKLDELLFASEEDDKVQHYILDGNRLHFNVFCSTASPHLGCADRTYFPIPRFAEVGIAKSMGETGRDLFRVNDLMKIMATSPKFTRPLALFRKRIAYANVYRTDFVVPGATAAFLDDNSDSLHYFDVGYESEREEDAQTKKQTVLATTCPASEKGLFVASCYTKRLPLSSPTESAGSELEIMSKSLDSLGWTKVFVNVRKEIPISAKVPSISNSVDDDCPIRRLSSKHQAVSSKDLCSAISSARDSRIILPFGHNAICAFERGSFSTAFNKGGRPVMDSLAINLVQDISLWTQNGEI